MTATSTKPAPVFFCLIRGLRGCYMPDEVAHHGVRTFEEFAAHVQHEVDFSDFAWNIDTEKCTERGLIDALLREAWDHAQGGYLELCIACAVDRDENGERCALNGSYGLTVSSSCARDMLEYRRACRDN